MNMNFKWRLQIKPYEELETLFLHSSKEYMFLSSSIVKEIKKYGGCLNGLVPDNLIPIIKSRFENSKILDRLNISGRVFYMDALELLDELEDIIDKGAALSVTLYS